MTEKKRIFCPAADARQQIRRKLEDMVDLTCKRYDQVRKQLDGFDDVESDQVMTEIASAVIIEYLGELFHRGYGVRTLGEAK